MKSCEVHASFKSHMLNCCCWDGTTFSHAGSRFWCWHIPFLCVYFRSSCSVTARWSLIKCHSRHRACCCLPFSWQYSVGPTGSVLISCQPLHNLTHRNPVWIVHLCFFYHNRYWLINWFSQTEPGDLCVFSHPFPEPPHAKCSSMCVYVWVSVCVCVWTWCQLHQLNHQLEASQQWFFFSLPMICGCIIPGIIYAFHSEWSSDRAHSRWQGLFIWSMHKRNRRLDLSLCRCYELAMTFVEQL